MNFKKGQPVKIKKGVTVDDLNFSIEGWQGRIGISEYDDDEMIMVELDSIVLGNLSEDYILETLRETGIESFNHFYLYKNDVELAEERDTLNDVIEKIKEIETDYSWKAESDGSPEEDLIAEVLKGATSEREELDAWMDYLQDNLVFPFKVKVEESDYGNHLRVGTKLKIKSIFDVDDMHGIIVEGKKVFQTVHCPLCDLEVIDKNDSNYIPIRGYVIWFANR